MIAKMLQTMISAFHSAFHTWAELYSAADLTRTGAGGGRSGQLGSQIRNSCSAGARRSVLEVINGAGLDWVLRGGFLRGVLRGGGVLRAGIVLWWLPWFFVVALSCGGSCFGQGIVNFLSLLCFVPVSVVVPGPFPVSVSGSGPVSVPVSWTNC